MTKKKGTQFSNNNRKLKYLVKKIQIPFTFSQFLENIKPSQDLCLATGKSNCIAKA
jgi:hypothetical protein